MDIENRDIFTKKIDQRRNRHYGRELTLHVIIPGKHDFLWNEILDDLTLKRSQPKFRYHSWKDGQSEYTTSVEITWFFKAEKPSQIVEETSVVSMLTARLGTVFELNPLLHTALLV